jgi:relaxase/mobilization nuclease family protein
MRNADTMIADLEAGGITSLDDLRSFFWNTHHNDDHTDELALLKKKYTFIDTLIAKIQHRDELALIYKEYKSKSGWAQSRFKKKNAAQIDDYEQTADYIKKHSKPLIVDGEFPPIYDLMGMSNKLKSKYNELLPEHTKLVTKHDTAKKYTKQVKRYLDEQYNRREREKSQQKKKNNYLE